MPYNLCSLIAANTMTNTNFWRGKRVFITGHTGFIGGWLYYWLHQLGADLFGYALPPSTQPNFYTLLGLDKIGNQDLGDIRDYDRLQRALRDFQPQIILHLAAQALVRTAHADPIDNFTTNVSGTWQLLDIARHLPNLAAMVVFTTDKVYENIEEAMSNKIVWAGWNLTGPAKPAPKSLPSLIGTVISNRAASRLLLCAQAM